jgi:hypothetical protein
MDADKVGWQKNGSCKADPLVAPPSRNSPIAIAARCRNLTINVRNRG